MKGVIFLVKNEAVSHIALIDFILSIGKAFKNGNITDIGYKLKNADKLSAQDAKDIADDFMYGLGDSIQNRTKDLILQFPMLCSDNISMENLTILNKAFEHDYASKIGLAIQSIPATSATNTIEFLKQFHKNIYANYVENFINYDKSTVKSINESCKKISKSPVINETSLNKVSISNILKEDITGNTNSANYKSNNNNNNNTTNNYYNNGSSSGDSVKLNGKDIEALNDMNPTIIKAKVYFISSAKNSDEFIRQSYLNSNSDGSTNVNVSVSNTDSHLISKDIMFGVKSIIHPLDHNEIVDYLANSTKGSNALFKFIRWRSGELRLFRDLLFCVDINKKMAYDNANKHSFWWRKLESMAQDKRLNTINNKLKKSSQLDLGIVKNKPIPTCTMVISKSDVDSIYEKYGINLLHDIKLPFKIMRHYFLMNFVIVDEATENVYIYDDNLKRYSMYTIKSLKSKASKSTVDIKDIIPLLKR